MVNDNNEKTAKEKVHNYKWAETPGTRNIIENDVPAAASALVSDNDPILLIAPTGTGKSYIKDEIIKATEIPAKDCVHVNCAAFSESLIDSELFGYKKGAFTDAAKDHPGLLGLKDKKLIVLDEINSLPKHLQAKLLIFLDSGEYRQVGGADINKSEMKIIGISNSAPGDAIFRPDFYYRFYIITVPALHERRLDILFYLKELCPNMLWCGKDLLRLLSYNWPGNVRELARFTRILNKHSKDTDSFMAPKKEARWSYFERLSFLNTYRNSWVPNVEPANFFLTRLRKHSENVRKILDSHFPNLALISNKKINLNETPENNPFKSYDLDKAKSQTLPDRDIERIWDFEWAMFCKMFHQQQNTDSDILKNIIAGRPTLYDLESSDYFMSRYEKHDPALPLEDSQQAAEREIYEGFFKRSEHKCKDSVSQIQADETGNLAIDSTAQNKYLESFFDAHDLGQYKEMWLKYHLDKGRSGTELARKYGLDPKTVQRWIREHKKEQEKNKLNINP